MQSFILPFSKISKKDINTCGGKGASLGEMTKSGISVPPGFVVLVEAFNRFLKENNVYIEIETALSKVNPKDTESVEEAAEIIRHLILALPINKDLASEIINNFKKLKTPYVAVRSSATAEDSKIDSWAGELESYLNTTEKTILENVKKCWASLFTPRAIFYRLERGLGGKEVLVAVVVQKMAQSEVSGICFTVHPVTKDRNQMIIEAGWGLGEAIVGGLITPDSYIIGKKNLKIIDVNISEQKKFIVRDGARGATVEKAVPRKICDKQKLNSKQIIELAKICVKIEKHYKKPQDIEWALEKNKFFIVQSRPITTL
ncbi:MAG TPA: PEP/pyruvate-binding domain-containing protein [Patescibacteria group bacterium]|nr:PEP/pyruvate-binding domain-containing protein [Patescibacteria group bacterium]